MTGRVAKYALLDTGFWIAMFDPTDRHHAAVSRMYEGTIEPLHVLAPWPCFYEFMGTRFMKKPESLKGLERALRMPGVHRVNDEAYRDRALEECFERGAHLRPLSLVDRVLRAVASDVANKLHAVVTVDPADFADVCRARRLELLTIAGA